MSASTSSGAGRTIVITGGLGNLGSKLCRHLLENSSSSPITRVILLEHPAFTHLPNGGDGDNPTSTKTPKPLPHPEAILIPCDLGNIEDVNRNEDLKNAMRNADALVHFSAVNPYPNATWSESARSMDHTFNIFMLAVESNVKRVILASSNHVMGGYKDSPTHGPASIHPYTNPNIGTIPLDPATLAVSGDAKAYAAAKLAGERLAMTLGGLYGDRTTFVVLRIGWCQPGENLPETLSAKGSPPEFLLEEESGGGTEDFASESRGMSEGDKKDELWFKRMWLSNKDFLNYFEKALEVDVPANTSTSTNPDCDYDDDEAFAHRNVRKGFVLVNAMSKNSGAKWNLEETERLLGVVSTDDSLK